MINDSNPNIPELGEVMPGLASDGTTLVNSQFLGGRKAFPVRDFSMTSLPSPPLTGAWLTAILLRNISGAAILPGRLARLCDAGSGSYGNDFGLVEAVEGYGNAVNLDTVVLLDPWLPSAGLLDDMIGWFVISGPAPGYTPQLAATAQGDIAVGELIVCSADAQGRVTRALATPASATAARDQAAGVLGRAMSARLDGETDAVIWVNWHSPVF